MWLRLRLCLSVTDKHLSLSLSFLLLYRPERVQGVWELSLWHLALREHHRLLPVLCGLPAWL